MYEGEDHGISYWNLGSGEFEVTAAPTVVGPVAVSTVEETLVNCWSSGPAEHGVANDPITMTVTPVIAGADQLPVSVDVANACKVAACVVNTEAGPNPDHVRISLASAGHAWARLQVEGFIPMWLIFKQQLGH